MIQEFYMYSAKPLDGGDSVTGYLCMRYIKDRDIDGYGLFIQPKDDLNRLIRIKEDTIEPLKVEAIMRDYYNDHGILIHTFPHCPHCNKILDELKKPRICPTCGMALKWDDSDTR